MVFVFELNFIMVMIVIISSIEAGSYSIVQASLKLTI